MTNKAKPFFSSLRKAQGAFSGFPLTILMVALIAAVLGWLAHSFLSGPSAVSSSPQPTALSTVAVTATNNPQALGQALDEKLKSMGLALLQTQQGSGTALVDGKNVTTHWESYRLPDLYTAQQLADLLNPVAVSMGAKLVNPVQGTQEAGVGTVYSCLFAGANQEPVQIDWVKTSHPRICIIIDDAGYERGEALAALYNFKVPVTSSIIPYTPYANFLANDFPLHGVEVMCHFPMEGHFYVRPGTYKEYLTTVMDLGKAKQEVQEGLADLPNCRGLNNHMGSVATMDLPLMEAVCQVLKSENMFVIDSVTSSKAVLGKAAQIEGVPLARREFFLDDNLTPAAISRQMSLTADYAQKHGLAIAIGHFKANELEVLQAEVQKLKAQGFQFVYASEVVSRP